MALAYLLMLAAMTYSAELFCMVVLGLTAGYALFGLDSLPPASTEACCSVSDPVRDMDMELRDMEMRGVRAQGGACWQDGGRSGPGDDCRWRQRRWRVSEINMTQLNEASNYRNL